MLVVFGAGFVIGILLVGMFLRMTMTTNPVGCVVAMGMILSFAFSLFLFVVWSITLI